jgi:hypothetical protein
MLLIPALALALGASVAPLIAAASLKIQIPPSTILANPNTLPASTHATLTTGQGPPIQAPLRKGNVFEFQDLPKAGSYLLDIYAHDYTFAPYRIDIGADDKISAVYETYRGTQWSDHGVQLVAEPTAAVTIQAKVMSKKSFYEERQGFNPVSLLKNPMILLGGVANFDLASWMAGAQQNVAGQTTKSSGIDAAAKSIRERRK